MQLMQTVLDDNIMEQYMSDSADEVVSGSFDVSRPASKAATASFTKGVTDLTKLLGEYAPTNLSDQMQSARSALQKFMSGDKVNIESIDEYRRQVKPLAQVMQRLHNITNRADRGKFLDTMRESNDAVVNQMLSQVIESNPNGLIAVEYLTSGYVPKNVPRTLVEREAENLWNQFVQIFIPAISNQMESLLQRDIAATMRVNMLQQSQGDLANMQSVMMQSMGPLQSKIQQIQQVNSAVFNVPTQITPHDRNQPIMKVSLQRYGKV